MRSLLLTDFYDMAYIELYENTVFETICFGFLNHQVVSEEFARDNDGYIIWAVVIKSCGNMVIIQNHNYDDGPLPIMLKIAEGYDRHGPVMFEPDDNISVLSGKEAEKLYKDYQKTLSKYPYYVVPKV